ncbi:MAG: tetratricopeptide repeat protein, partial [Bryobacteraceae bacterium]
MLVATGCNSESRKRRALEVGNKYYDEGKYRPATIAYGRALQLDPRYGEAHYRLGLARIRLRLIAQAIQSLRRACELQPNNEDAHARLGDLYLAIYLSNPSRNQRQLMEFGELADSLMKRNSSSFEGLRLKGYQLLGEGKLEEAIEVFQEANRTRPGQGAVVLVLAQTLAAGGRFEEAETLTRTFLETEKTYGPAYDFLYGQYVGRNRPSDATEILRLKVSNNPKQPDFVLQLATHYRRINEPTLVAETLALMSGNLKDFPNAYMQLGDYFYRLQQFPVARTYYDQGASLGKTRLLAYKKKIVECLYAENRRDEAMRMVTDLLGAHKDDMELRALRAALRLQGRDPKEISTAVEELQAAVARMPENPVLRFRLGEGLAAKGEFDQARLQFEEAIKLRAGYMAPMYGLAGIYLAKNDFTRVSQVASDILTISPNDLNARLLRVNALIGLRDQTRARAELDLMLKANSKLTQALFLLAG